MREAVYLVLGVQKALIGGSGGDWARLLRCLLLEEGAPCEVSHARVMRANVVLINTKLLIA